MCKGHQMSLETTSSGRQQLTEVKVDRYIFIFRIWPTKNKMYRNKINILMFVCTTVLYE